MIVVAGEALIDLMPRAGEAPPGAVRPGGASPEAASPDGARPEEARAEEARAGGPEPGGPQWFDARPGGAPCNVAVGLARLGQHACFLGRVGSDPFGQLLRGHLLSAGVDTSMVVAATEKTTLAVTALDGQGKAEYSFYVNGTADWQWTGAEVPRVLPAGTRALYMGGLALRLAPGAAVLEGLMQRTWQEGRALVFFDPNVRTGFGFSATAERARVERQLAFAHVIKASEDDIALLYPGRNYREIAAAWQETMSGLVTVTLGPAGVYALGPDGTEIHVAAAPAEVVDTVGAGDAFAAAMLDRLAGALAGVLDGAGGGAGSAAGAGEPGVKADGVAASVPVAAAVRGVSPDVLRGLLERASVSAALTCEQVGAQSPDARTLDTAMNDEARRPEAEPAPDQAAVLERAPSPGPGPESSSGLEAAASG